MAVKLVFLIEMATKHLGRLVYSMLNLNSNTSTSLRFLDDIIGLVVDL